MDRRAFLQQVLQPQTNKSTSGDATPDVAQPTASLAPWQPSAANPWDSSAVKHLHHRLGIAPSYQWLLKALAREPLALIEELMDNAYVTTLLPSPPDGWENWLVIPPYMGTDNTKQLAEDSMMHIAKMDLRNQWTHLLTLDQIFLREKLLLFWSNHFVIQEQKIYFTQQIYHFLDYLRRNCWGNFKEMVKRVSIEPAMLVFLDGIWSEKDKLNENYARELMELFTMGRTDASGKENYTQQDVRAMALALTGWRFRYEEPGPYVTPSYFAWYYFDYETKTTPFGAPAKVYGLASSNDPKIEADIIDTMFEYRGDQIATFICTKLYKYFVYNDASGSAAQQVIAALASDFKKNWEIKPVLLKLLKSEHFFDLTFRASDIKSPYEFMLGMSRQLNIEVSDSRGGTMTILGIEQNQWLIDPPNVKGWPGYRTWLTGATLMKRNEYISKVTVGGGADSPTINPHDGQYYDKIEWHDWEVVNWAKQFENYQSAYKEFVRELASFFFAIPPSEAQVEDVRKRSAPPNTEDWLSMTDDQRIPTIRKTVQNLLLIAEYHLC